MDLPFTADELLASFERYNRAIAPAQAVAYAAACLVVARLLLRPGRTADLGAGALLAASWAFTGAVYFPGFLAPLSGIALPAAALFLVEAALLAVATARGRLRLARRRGPRAAAGGALVLYAMVAYPLLGAIAGHALPRGPAFGVTPCPVVLFTWGLLLLAEAPPRRLVPIPLLWSLAGTSAALRLGMREDLALPAAAALAAALLLPGAAAPRRRGAAPARGAPPGPAT